MMATRTIHLLHTNDVHSELQAFGKLVTPFRDLRNGLLATGASVLCFDIGDHVDISHPISAATSGKVNVEMLQNAGYDAWVPGNNESLMLAPHRLAALREQSQIPLLCANVQGCVSHLLYEVGGVTLGVFGVTVYFPLLHDCLHSGVTEPIAAAWRVTQMLRAKGADVVVMLSHLGFAADQALADGLAVDVILGGHSHHFLSEAVQRSNTWICQAGKYAQAFGHTVLHLEQDGGRVSVRDVSSTLIYSAPSEVMDRGISGVLMREAKAAQAWLDETIVQIAQPLPHSVLGESVLANILCDELRTSTGSDLALINGGIIAGCLRQGELRRRDLLANCPSPMRAVVCVLSGREILQIVSEAWYGELAERRGFGFGFRGYLIGLLHLSGGHVTLSGEDSETGVTIKHLVIADQPLALTRSYRVAICEFVALSHVRSVLGDLQYAYYPEMLRDVYARGLSKAQAVAQGRTRRYRLQPGVLSHHRLREE
ncbi:MAG: 5'-nucleotidase C-terminal domain-containing protein [Firmicutes bacterium]|nr:5'-nucleotidase C-terminal domain-containing protein [Bacillota bacterium]